MNEPGRRFGYQFGEFVLDAGRLLLFRKGESAPLAAKPKVLEALLYFVEHHGVLLEKDTLLAALWPGVVVEENSLTQLISSLRRILGESRAEHRYLLTVPGRGYRFVADVTSLDLAGLAPPAGFDGEAPGSAALSARLSLRRPAIALAAAVAVIVAAGAVAVLLVHPAVEWRSGAIVAPRAPASGELARLQAQFGTDAALAYRQGRALIASRRIEDAQVAIDRFSRAIEGAPHFAAAYAALAHAHRHLAYLQEDRNDARTLMADALVTAEPLLQKALELDPLLGEAYVMRAEVRTFHGDLDAAEADYRKGLALSPNYATGHEQFAEFLEMKRGDTAAALSHYDMARASDPGVPRNHYRKGLLLMLNPEHGSTEQAETLFLQALEVDPRFYPALLRLGQIRWAQGRFAEAVKLGEQALAIEPQGDWMRWFLVDFYLEVGEVEAARRVLLDQPREPHPSQWLTICARQRDVARAADLVRLYAGRDSGWFADVDMVMASIRDDALRRGEPGRALQELRGLQIEYVPPREQHAGRVAAMSQVSVVLGNTDEARRLARKVLAIDADRSGRKSPYERAVALTVLGEPDAAIELLQGAVERGYFRRWWYAFEHEPGFDPLRADPRFAQAAESARTHAEAQRRVLDQMRVRGEVPRRGAPGSRSAARC